MPRSFLKDDQNTLVLFEEMGGNPLQVNFQTVTVGTVCANVNEGSTMELACQGDRPISHIQYASYGDPQGSCKSFKKGTCEADNALAAVQKVKFLISDQPPFCFIHQNYIFIVSA